MENRRLGKYGLEVPALCLGTMTFGLQVDEEKSVEILDRACDLGLSFLDSADAYPLGGNRDTLGRTEEILGRWMKQRGNRQRLLIATKCFAPTRGGPNGRGLSRQHIMESIEASLTRLGTDHIDIYQSHGFDEFTPIEETLRAFQDLVTEGKVRYIGCSNYPAWRLGQALAAADRLGVGGYVSVQPRYNLLYREIETELLPLCRAEGLGVLVYNPLAGGFLSGKYTIGEEPREGTRFTLGSAAGRYQERYWHEVQFKAVEELKQVVADRDMNMVSVAIAWVLAQEGISSAIIGASSPEQLDANLAALEITLDEELLSACDEAWWSLPRRPVHEGYR
ncbi:MAG: aldo/keto reductase [Pseudomonadales bacterium]|jgi:aryl-alcohol dehydrogenase (NADP+)|nr:aldo/keto reductase [Pseudomonadales bacterium]MDP7360303.1 aldo/keto reductase [Pseudomonadales bacterium]MDP7597585.1 aldo/keto reductase [Pseudomonadales bacterium]HJN50799.1 aldo/keto reductase [Pseudomonadales bacterium]